MKLNMYIIDAFTTELFHGNQAAVIILSDWLSDETMQLIATENNLSETAFAVKYTPQHYHIRWFSPLCEIDFCGHATLATAFVLFQQLPNLTQLTFNAKAVGNIDVVKQSNGLLEMNFPNKKPQPLKHIPSKLLAGLSISPVEVLRSEQAYFVVYANELQVKQVNANSSLLKTLAPFDVVVTAPSTDYDFVSRYFWPANGGDEDPVTGSIHAGLAPYWAEQINKTNLTAFQASKRGGILHCRVSEERVFVAGSAVQYLQGTITINEDN